MGAGTPVAGCTPSNSARALPHHKMAKNGVVRLVLGHQTSPPPSDTDVDRAVEPIVRSLRRPEIRRATEHDGVDGRIGAVAPETDQEPARSSRHTTAPRCGCLPPIRTGAAASCASKSGS